MLLYADSDGNGTLDAGRQLVAATVTDALRQLPLHRAERRRRTSSTSTRRRCPAPLLALTTADPAGTLVTLADRTIATQVLTADAGYSPGANYALGNRVWSDADGDNVQDRARSASPASA